MHASVLLVSLQLLNSQRRPPLLINVNLADPFAAGPSQTPRESSTKPEKRTAVRKPTTDRSAPVPAQRTAPPSSGEMIPSKEPETGNETTSTGMGPLATDSKGSPIGREGPSSEAGRTTLERGSQSGTGTASGPATRSPGGGTSSPAKIGSPLLKGPPPVTKDDVDLTKLPDAQFRDQQSIIVFYEADTYILFAGAEKIGFPVPGTDLCIDGTFLRTVERQKLTHSVVDLGKCSTKMDDDSDRLFCPRGAATTTTYFSDYLRTPIEYRVNHCLAYDNSHCYEVTSDDSDTEICKVNFDYNGIWAADTNFAYRCTKWETRTFRNPLEYTIRYMEILEHGDQRNNRAKQFHRVVRSIPQCSK